MSTSPERIRRADDELISVLSHWLARHLDTPALRKKLGELGTKGLSANQAGAVDELATELRQERSRPELEPVVRETIEALALDL
jgi:hypothetical protein